MIITEDYVPFEIAKLLDEKGFKSYGDECFAFYNEDKEIKFLQTFGDVIEYNEDSSILAPTLQMIMKWLRLVYKIDIIPNLTSHETVTNYGAKIL